MMELDPLIVLLDELRVLAKQVGDRGSAPKKDDPPAAFFFGIQLGYEEAAERLEAIMRRGGWTP
jgi:hypothetical protein